jgi:rhamnulokinase
MAEDVYLAVDLGASGGRVMAGVFDGRRLALEEIHRFANGPIAAAGSLYWDALGLSAQINQGLRAAGAKYGRQIKSIGVDAWGVDFALLGRDDAILGNPYCYRDRRTDGVMDQVLQKISRQEIFAQTGLQFMPINTLFQVVAMRQQNSPLLEAATSFLMMPDFFHWLLTGVKANEMTNATTTQFYNPLRRGWAVELFEKLDLPTRILGNLIEPGTRLGPLRPDVADDTGLAGVEVIAPGTHDTASAVMAVPATSHPGERPNWCYISSGTWSLMGVETPKPVVTDRCRELNFTNEGGVGGTTRLLKNITGLWLVQECRRVWSKAGREYRWQDLQQLMASAPRLASFVDPDHASFQTPTDMPEAIRAYCRRTGQAVPADDGSVIRTAIESLALKCRYVLGCLEDLAETRMETIHIVGGGTQNRELCQATADACQRPVVTGPVEATALGNVMMQAVTQGACGSIAQARDIIRDSFPVERYEPRDADLWQDAYAKLRSLIERA